MEGGGEGGGGGGSETGRNGCQQNPLIPIVLLTGGNGYLVPSVEIRDTHRLSIDHRLDTSAKPVSLPPPPPHPPHPSPHSPRPTHLLRTTSPSPSTTSPVRSVQSPADAVQTTEVSQCGGGHWSLGSFSCGRVATGDRVAVGG